MNVHVFYVFIALAANSRKTGAFGDAPTIDFLTNIPADFREEWCYKNTQRVHLKKMDNVSFEVNWSDKTWYERKQDNVESVIQSITLFAKDTYNVNIFPLVERRNVNLIFWLNITDTFLLAESSDFRILCFRSNSSVENSGKYVDYGENKPTKLYLCSTRTRGRSTELQIVENGDLMTNGSIMINHEKIEAPFIYKSNEMTFAVSAEINKTALILPTYVFCQNPSFKCNLKPKIITYDKLNPLSILPPRIFRIFGWGDYLVAIICVDYTRRKITVKTIKKMGHGRFPRNQCVYVQVKIYNSIREEKDSYDIFGTEQPIEEKEFDFEIDYIISFIAIEPHRVKTSNQNLFDVGSNEFKVTSKGLTVLPPNMIYYLDKYNYTIAYLHFDFARGKLQAKIRKEELFVTIKMYNSSHREVYSFGFNDTAISIYGKEFNFETGYVISTKLRYRKLAVIGNKFLKNSEAEKITIKSQGFNISTTDPDKLINMEKNILLRDLAYRPNLRKYLYFEWLMDVYGVHKQENPNRTSNTTVNENLSPNHDIDSKINASAKLNKYFANISSQFDWKTIEKEPKPWPPLNESHIKDAADKKHQIFINNLKRTFQSEFYPQKIHCEFSHEYFSKITYKIYVTFEGTIYEGEMFTTFAANFDPITFNLTRSKDLKEYHIQHSNDAYKPVKLTSSPHNFSESLITEYIKNTSISTIHEILRQNSESFLQTDFCTSQKTSDNYTIQIPRLRAIDDGSSEWQNITIEGLFNYQSVNVMPHVGDDGIEIEVQFLTKTITGSMVSSSNSQRFTFKIDRLLLKNNITEGTIYVEALDNILVDPPLPLSHNSKKELESIIANSIKNPPEVT